MKKYKQNYSKITTTTTTTTTTTIIIITTYKINHKKGKTDH
jgi:hypothetical protein